ncbi:NUDIX domain-containing protein [Candidatus Bipolaricaulota bacterium]|nr:NUDIX domain-containing protein [Candidatus Bipolaricaulota bacterium]
MGHQLAAGFVLFRNVSGKRHYLIVCNRQGGHWGFPKGHIEPGEDELSAARREVAEEVGIGRLEPVAGFREKITYRFLQGGEQVEKEVVFFLARTQEAGNPAPKEIRDMRWLPYEEALERITHEEQRGVLRRAEAFLSGHQDRSPP